jgi:hypothetical protein
VSPGQAAYIVERLVKDRVITGRELRGYVAGMDTEIRALEARIATLKDGAATANPPESERRTGGKKRRARAGTMGRPTAVDVSESQAEAPAKKRRTRISGAQLAARKLQGQYLGFIRQVPANKRGRFKKIAKESGRDAAIAALRAALGK